MYFYNINDMVNKEVEVISDGMAYHGVLVEITETEVSIQGPFGYISVPIEMVTSISLVD